MGLRILRVLLMSPLDQLNQAPDDQSELTMSVLMTPDMAISQVCHGGAILKLLIRLHMLARVVIQVVM